MDDLDEPNAQTISGSKEAILDVFNKLRKWREEQVEQFQSMQMLEGQKLLQKSLENGKQFEHFTGKNVLNSVKEVSSKNSSPPKESSSNVSLAESSVTGHLMHCFSDSSECPSPGNDQNPFKNVLSPSRIGVVQTLIESAHLKEAVKSKMETNGVVGNVKKPTRPFLRKGSGLLSYMANTTGNKPSKSRKTSFERKPPCAQKTLKLKPAIRNESSSSEKVKHIRFDEPVLDTVIEEPTVKQQQLQKSPVELDDVNKIVNNENSRGGSKLIDTAENYLPDEKNTSVDSLSLEHKELAEFELLETCAQNSSFNSDSSLVQRVLHGDEKLLSQSNAKLTKSSDENSNCLPNVSKVLDSAPSFPPKTGLNKCLAEVQTRKQQLQQMISDINPRIASLQKEICNSNNDVFDDEDSDLSERCSTPIADPDNFGQLNDMSSKSSFDSKIEVPKSLDVPAISNKASCDSGKDAAEPFFSEKANRLNNLKPENIISSESEETSPVSCPATAEKSKFKEKIIELAREINIYQDLNAKLADICKERDKIVQKLKKERDEFQKYKDDEKNKLEAELVEERRQIRRQKETFVRYQKLRGDNPTKKEREELASLRQEIEKLQEELKRQNIKYNNDTRRLKTQLITAEKERDCLKLENIKLEEQCQDLLSSLKIRNKKWKKLMTSEITNNIEPVKIIPNPEEDPETTELKNVYQENIEDIQRDDGKPVAKKRKDSKTNLTKLKVRFNLSPEFEKSEKDENMEDNQEEKGNEFVTLDELITKLNSICDEEEPSIDLKGPEGDNLGYKEDNLGYKEDNLGYKEIDHGHKIERIYDSGEVEIIFPSGTRKLINAEGDIIKFLFYNGDVKEVFSDQKEIYKYANGVIETHFPDGLEVTEFNNGQIQKRYPEGNKEVIYPDGTTHTIYKDGSEEIHATDGTVVTLGADGTETVEFTNGQREIRTSNFKRREYPDGSIKIVYESGRQETRYANGRIRIKDKEGKLVVDTKYLGGLKGQKSTKAS